MGGSGGAGGKARGSGGGVFTPVYRPGGPGGLPAGLLEGAWARVESLAGTDRRDGRDAPHYHHFGVPPDGLAAELTDPAPPRS